MWAIIRIACKTAMIIIVSVQCTVCVCYCYVGFIVCARTRLLAQFEVEQVDDRIAFHFI